MQKHFRLNEYKVLLYRLSLAYLFYFIARVLFYLYNADLMCRVGFDFASLSYYGLAFDTTAILYVNLLFIVLSIFPYGKTLVKDIKSFSFTFISDLIYNMQNYIDFIYYKYTFARLQL
jgi:hypothetical protein